MIRHKTEEGVQVCWFSEWPILSQFFWGGGNENVSSSKGGNDRKSLRTTALVTQTS